MNVELFIHGKPYNHCVWNKDSVQDGFIDNLYVTNDNVKEQSTLVIDIFRKSNAVSSYYTYMRTCNYVDSTGRPGSFFGMTLRFDGYYCREVAHVYNILNEAYERTIVGNIIESRNGVSRYRISDFKQADGVLKKLYADLDARLNISMFQPIDSSFTGRDAKRVEAFNPADTGSLAFFESLKLCCKAYVSPEYMSKSAIIAEYKRRYMDEHESVERERSTSAARQQQIDELSQRLDDERRQSAELRKQIDGNPLKEELAKERQKSLKLEDDNLVLRQHNEELSSREPQLNADVYERIDTLSSEMKKLRKLVREVGCSGRSSARGKNYEDGRPGSNGSGGRISGLLRCRKAIWIVIAVVLASVVYTVHSCNDDKKTADPKTEQSAGVTDDAKRSDPKNGANENENN